MSLDKLSRKEYLALPREERFRRTIKLSKTEEERAAELQRKFISIDFHSHAMEKEYPDAPTYTEVRTHPAELLDILPQSGVTCFWENHFSPHYNFDLTIREMAITFNHINNRGEKYVLAHRAEDIRRAKKEGKIAFMKGVEPQTVGNDLDKVDTLYGLGVRSATLTYNTRCMAGDGCGGRTNCGLSLIGVKLVEKMNEVGMLIDLSHVGEKTSLETIEVSKDPVAFTHNGAKSLYEKCNKMRTDEEIKALAEKGGVIGIEAVPNTLSFAKVQGVKDMLDHIDYVVGLVGVDYVAIGCDSPFGDHVDLHRAFMKFGVFTPDQMGIHELYTDYMRGIENPTEWPNLTRGLVSRGYSDQEIEKIIGGNVLRLIDEVIG